MTFAEYKKKCNDKIECKKVGGGNGKFYVTHVNLCDS